MNVVLTGFMGTGKSSVGKALAGRLGLDFVDTDALASEKAGMTVAEIFARRGEERFRELEKEVIGEVTSGPGGVVVATGGGAVMDKTNRERLSRFGSVVCLTASIEVIMDRVGEDAGGEGGDERPLLADAGSNKVKRDNAMRLLASRKTFYAEADLTIDTSNITVSEVVRAVEDYLSSK